MRARSAKASGLSRRPWPKLVLAPAILTAMLAVAAVAHAQSSTRAEPPPVKVWLRGTEPDLRFDLYTGTERDRGTLTRSCRGSCAFRLLPDRYYLRVSGPPGSDVRTSGRYFDLRESSQVLVDPPSCFFRWFGFALGMVGPAVMGEWWIEGAIHQDSLREPVPAWRAYAAAAAVLVVTPMGWLMFAANGSPTVQVFPMPDRSGATGTSRRP